MTACSSMRLFVVAGSPPDSSRSLTIAPPPVARDEDRRPAARPRVAGARAVGPQFVGHGAEGRRRARRTMLAMRAWPAILAVILLLPAAARAAPALEAVGTFTSPIDVASPPGDASRLFVVERGGTVRVVKDGVTLATPFLTIPAGAAVDRRRARAARDDVRARLRDLGPPLHVLDRRRRRHPRRPVACARPIRTSRSRRARSSSRSSTARATTTTAATCTSGRRLPLHLDRRRRRRRRSRLNGQTLIRAGTADEQSTALLAKLLRIAPGPTRQLHDPGRQPVRRPRGRARRDLRVRPAQPVSLLVRPRDRRPA